MGNESSSARNHHVSVNRAREAELERELQIQKKMFESKTRQLEEKLIEARIRESVAKQAEQQKVAANSTTVSSTTTGITSNTLRPQPKTTPNTTQRTFQQPETPAQITTVNRNSATNITPQAIPNPQIGHRTGQPQQAQTAAQLPGSSSVAVNPVNYTQSLPATGLQRAGLPQPVQVSTQLPGPSAVNVNSINNNTQSISAPNMQRVSQQSTPKLLAPSSFTAIPFGTPTNTVAGGQCISKTTLPNNLYPSLHQQFSQVSINSEVPVSNLHDPRSGLVSVNSNITNQSAATAPVPSAPQISRDRSSSRTRYRPYAKKNLDQTLKCQTCNENYGLVIHLCSSGHSACIHCKQRMLPCGVCREPITDMRNFALEQRMGQMKTNCPNSSDGCCIYIPLMNMDAHIMECPFGEYRCPINSIKGNYCRWRGKVNQMANHFDEHHFAQRQADVDKEMSLPKISNDTDSIYYITLGTFNFLFYLRSSSADKKVYMAAQLIGTHKSASKWAYEIHVYNKSQPRRKFEYTDICTSHLKQASDLFTESKCAVLPFAYAKTFVNHDAINYKFYLKKHISTK